MRLYTPFSFYDNNVSIAELITKPLILRIFTILILIIEKSIKFIYKMSICAKN
jgi:hypothetical protein